MSEKSSNLFGFHFIILGIPLIIYPGVFIADIMSLAGEKTGNESILSLVFSKLFIYSTLFYPLIFLICLILFFITKKLLFIKTLYIYLIACLGFFGFWSITESSVIKKASNVSINGNMKIEGNLDPINLDIKSE